MDLKNCNIVPGRVYPPLPSPAFAGKNVVLASNSPRRRELLGYIIPSFSIAENRDVEETYSADLEPCRVPEYLSRLKASAYTDMLRPDELLITADTVVILDGRILGKPHDRADACRMLGELSGKAHTVVTGVTLSSTEKSVTFSEHTTVHFGPLTADEIRNYVERYRPLDKAGAYGIQEWVGAAAIKCIEGCYYNVMGLPLHALYTQLKTFYN